MKKSIPLKKKKKKSSKKTSFRIRSKINIVVTMNINICSESVETL